MSSMNIFERASRAKLRFACAAGNLSVEDLFDLQLQNTHARMDLDRLSRQIYNEFKGYDEVSFVDTKPNLAKIELQLKLDLVKHVIAAKQAEADATQTRIKNEQRRQKLLEVLAKKQDTSLEAMDEADILKELEALTV